MDDFKTYKPGDRLTPEMNKQMTTEEKKKWLIPCLRDNYGIILTACRLGCISNRSYYKWIKEDPDFKAEAEAAREEATDFVEKKLFDSIKEGNSALIMFYLRTRGRDRGYNETITNINYNKDISIGFEDDADDADDDITDIIE